MSFGLIFLFEAIKPPLLIGQLIIITTFMSAFMGSLLLEAREAKKKVLQLPNFTPQVFRNGYSGKVSLYGGKNKEPMMCPVCHSFWNEIIEVKNSKIICQHCGVKVKIGFSIISGEVTTDKKIIQEDIDAMIEESKNGRGSEAEVSTS